MLKEYITASDVTHRSSGASSPSMAI